MAGVKLSAGQAHPGDPLLILEKMAAGESFQVLHEPAGMHLICLCHAAEGSGDAGIAFILGSVGIKGTVLVPDGVFIRCGSAQHINGRSRQGRRFLRVGEITAAMLQQPFQDGDMFCLLGGGEAENVGDDLLPACFQSAGSLLI